MKGIEFNFSPIAKPDILIDVDGVLLEWTSKLAEYFVTIGIDPEKAHRAHAWGEFISPAELTGLPKDEAMKVLEDYNASVYIKYLTPYKDALQVINMLKQEWNFIAVTALGTDRESVDLRMENLNFYFPNAFSKVHAVGIEDSKEEILSQYPKTFFIDDSPEHTKTAKECGHISIRLKRDSRLCLTNTIVCNDFHEIGTIIELHKSQIE